MTIQDENFDKSKLSKYLILSVIYVIAGILIPLIIFITGISRFLTLYGFFLSFAVIGIIGLIMYLIDKEIFYGMFQNKRKLGQEANEKILKGVKIARISMMIGMLLTVIFFVIDMITFANLLSSL